MSNYYFWRISVKTCVFQIAQSFYKSLLYKYYRKWFRLSETKWKKKRISFVQIIHISDIFFNYLWIKSSYCQNKKYETENLATILSWSWKVFHFLYVMHNFSFWFLFFLLYFIKEFKISWFTNKYATVIFM